MIVEFSSECFTQTDGTDIGGINIDETYEKLKNKIEEFRKTENKNDLPTMYNRNYGGFDYVRIHSELLTAVLNRKLTHINP